MQEMVSASLCNVLHLTPNKGKGDTDSLTDRRRRRKRKKKRKKKTKKKKKKKRGVRMCVTYWCEFMVSEQKSPIISCTHNTTHTQNLHKSNGTLRFNLAFYADQYLF
jgi:hypothetical protein